MTSKYYKYYYYYYYGIIIHIELCIYKNTYIFICRFIQYLHIDIRLNDGSYKLYRYM